mmetsp:Transcript_19581/g.50574  ORF Transcript_19581/g.50574 Transcript_19581/m.50574 type:complete len:242 (-) Transcript_19581:18-743(-)
MLPAYLCPPTCEQARTATRSPCFPLRLSSSRKNSISPGPITPHRLSRAPCAHTKICAGGEPASPLPLYGATLRPARCASPSASQLTTSVAWLVATPRMRTPSGNTRTSPGASPACLSSVAAVSLIFRPLSDSLACFKATFSALGSPGDSSHRDGHGAPSSVTTNTCLWCMPTVPGRSSMPCSGRAMPCCVSHMAAHAAAGRVACTLAKRMWRTTLYAQTPAIPRGTAARNGIMDSHVAAPA